MSRGRLKGTKLSAEHRASLSAALKGHTPWNKGNVTPVKEKPKLSIKEKEQINAARAAKSAETRKLNTARKYIHEAEQSQNWSNAKFTHDSEANVDYLEITHTCGNTVKVQTQTIRKWSFGDGLCKHCNPVFRGTSAAEDELANFVGTHQDIIRHQKLGKHELDIFIPEKKIAIEYNGLYWHSEKAGYPNNRHLDKTNACADNGIRLIHVFEDEFIHKREIVQSRINAVLGNTSKLHARKLTIDMNVPASEARVFLNSTHIQGFVGAKVRIGLRCGSELVSIMTFGKPRFNKSYDWELLRFSSKLGITVVGGASKLLHAFRRQFSGGIISYADRRWSNGNVYEKLGFSFMGKSAPSYYYFKGDLRYNRQTFQKSKLKAALGEAYEADKTEAEMMFSSGWNRIWDCGNLIYTLK